MKSDRVLLCEWWGDSEDGYIDIPWPMVHEWLGNDAVRWLNQQPTNNCQMILEKDPDHPDLQKLYAEFYVPSLRSEFAIRFAK
jgi:hypothetical protein